MAVKLWYHLIFVSMLKIQPPRFVSIGAGKRTRRYMATVAQGEAIAQGGECTGTRPICAKLTSKKLVDQLSLVLRLTHYFSEVSIFYLVND